MLHKCLVFISTFFVSFLILAEPLSSEYVEIKQIYADKQLIAVTVNSSVKLGKYVSILKNNSTCELEVSSKTDKYFFLNTGSCININEVTVGQRLEVALLQNRSSNQLTVSETPWNQSHLDFKLKKGSFHLRADAGTETATGTIKFSGVKIGSLENTSNVVDIKSKYGLTNQLTMGASIGYSIDSKSVTRITNSPESSVKIIGESNPTFEANYSFKEGRLENEWSPSIDIAIAPKFSNGKYRSTEELYRSGGTALRFGFSTVKKLDESLLGFAIDHINKLERTYDNSEKVETTIATGGHSTGVSIFWQHINDDNNTFGFGWETKSNTSSTSTVSTPSSSSKNENSSIVKNNILLRGSLLVSQGAVINVGYDYQLPYDYTFKSGSNSFDVSGDSVSSFGLGFSILF